LSHYSKHIFVCTNQKDNGKACCANQGGAATFEYLRSRLLELELQGPGKFRVSRSGCLGRCSEGPCMVVYPEGLWYACRSSEDVDKFIAEQLVADRPVSDLLIDKDQGFP